MVESIVGWIVNAFSGLSSIAFGKEILVFIISLMPILELRGGLIAASLLKLNLLPSFIITYIGTILPIPFILWFIKSIIDWMGKTKKFKGIAEWLNKKAEKNKPKIDKYGFWGLVLFVGIPLPGTGAWTGSLVAALFEMDRKKSFLAAALGILMASIIMMILSFGLLKGIIA
jgi:uncharacterized membrane protein